MSARAVVSGVVTTGVLVAALGSPAAQHAAADAQNRVLGRTLTSFPSWDAADASADVRWAIAVRLAVLVLTTALLCAVAGRSASRGAALLAGWAAAVAAAACAGAAAHAYGVATESSRASTVSGLDQYVAAANRGAVYGLWTGWLVGVAVAAVTHRTRMRSRAIATPPHGTRIADPPPPWWAPTGVAAGTPTGAPAGAAADEGEPTLRPEPVTTPPGHMPPVVAGLGEDEGDDTHVMTTVSGDPHPSDPDATEAIAYADDDPTLHMPGPE